MLVKVKLEDSLSNLLSNSFNYVHCILILPLKDEGVPFLPDMVYYCIDNYCVQLPDLSCSSLLFKRSNTLLKPFSLRLNVPVPEGFHPDFPCFIACEEQMVLCFIALLTQPALHINLWLVSAYSLQNRQLLMQKQPCSKSMSW